MSIKYKRKFANSPTKDNNHKFKAYPTILKEAMAVERKKKQKSQEEEKK